MRGRRLIFVFTLAIFLVLGISLGSARALEFSDWGNTWHKTKFKIKAVCYDIGLFEFFKASDKEAAWIYIASYAPDAFDAFLVTMDEDGTWQATGMTLTILRGTPDEMILELDSAITIVDGSTGQTVEVLYFFVWLKGKEKEAALKSGKLKSVAGAATIEVIGEGDCVSSLEFSGKLTAEEKVPQEAIDALP